MDRPVSSVESQVENALHDDGDMILPPHLSSSSVDNQGVALRHGDILEEEGVTITPHNIAIQYYRRETLRMVSIAMVLACVDLFITPIDAFVLLPAAVAASYWLRDTVRFAHGGDLRKCFNRDCALMYFHVCCGVALAISILDCVILIANFSRSGRATHAAATPAPMVVRSQDASSAPTDATGHSSTWYAVAIGVNACSAATLLYGFYCTRKLRRLLEQGVGDTSSLGVEANTAHRGIAVHVAEV
jgi:hypothetical protein